MNTSLKTLRLLPVFVAGLGVMLAGRVTAQTFTTLHSFSASGTNSSGDFTNSDGVGPVGGLILSGNTLYGTASGGGSSGVGTVFAVHIDGTGFTNLHNFSALNNSTNSDGARPYAGLILSGNTLYGTAFYGGGLGNGTVFAVNTDGSGFRALYSFAGGSDGGSPYAGLILSSNTLYGTAVNYGRGAGTVFAVNTDGSGFTSLYEFTGGSDGANPWAGLILSSNTLYGTAYLTVFAVNTDGTGFTNLHTLAVSSAGLILSGNTLYGNATGAVFKVNTDGTGFTTLYSFVRGRFSQFGRLILSGSTLYGTAGDDLIVPFGIIFAVNTDGTGFTTLHSFGAKLTGAVPGDGLVLSRNTLYGTFSGISSDAVFSLSLIPPQLTITPAGASVILTWPTNAIEFSLQSTTNLASSAVWTTNSPATVVVNGQNTVTNPISGTQQFYRLAQ